MSRTIESPLSLNEARERILGMAEPGEPIEVSLVNALGLVLAEPAIADVDLPPFDRARTEGYAVRAAEATRGALLRVAGKVRSGRDLEAGVETGEAIRVDRGDPMPIGSDAVVRSNRVRADPETGPARVIEIREAVEAGRDVVRRGLLLEAGAVLAPAGTRLRAPMVGLLASQGCVHPVCHRRVRVAVIAVGDHLVGPAEAPVMHRERNAVNAAIAAMAVQAGAMPHDFQAVAGSRLRPVLDRAASAPVLIVLGPPSRPVLKAFRSVGVESVVAGVSFRPGGRARYGVIRDGSGRVTQHVFRLPLAPVAAATAFALLARPLIARLQGGPTAGTSTPLAVWDGSHRATSGRLRAVPVVLVVDGEARTLARPIPLHGMDDLPGFSRADGLALLPARTGPWVGGETVEVVRLD